MIGWRKFKEISMVGIEWVRGRVVRNEVGDRGSYITYVLKVMVRIWILFWGRLEFFLGLEYWNDKN